MAVQFEKTIRTLLDEKKYQTLKDILVTMEPADIAGVFEDLEEERMPLLFRLLPKETAAETFAELDSEWQELLIRGFSDRELHEVVNELYVDDAADLVDEMPANVVKRILAQADPQMRKEINEILRYPENSAGSIMTTEYVSLRPGMTVAEAITRIRRTGVEPRRSRASAARAWTRRRSTPVMSRRGASSSARCRSRICSSLRTTTPP